VVRMALLLVIEPIFVVNLHKAGASLDFLGFTFRFDRHRRGGGRYLNIVPSTQAMNRVRRRLREMTQRRVQQPLAEVIGKLNRYLRGWRNYFSFGYPRLACKKVNWYVQTRLRCFMRTRSRRRGRQLEGPSRYQALRSQGLIYL